MIIKYRIIIPAENVPGSECHHAHHYEHVIKMSHSTSRCVAQTELAGRVPMSRLLRAAPDGVPKSAAVTMTAVCVRLYRVCVCIEWGCILPSGKN